MSERRVVIVDYGVGNLLSAQRAFVHCGGKVTLTGNPQAVAAADRLVVPGVGAFGHCLRQLEARGLVDPVKSVVAGGRPMIGICVGMQMLFEGSEEFGRHSGLGFLQGWIKRIPTDGQERSWTASRPGPRPISFIPLPPGQKMLSTGLPTRTMGDAEFPRRCKRTIFMEPSSIQKRVVRLG